MKEINDKKAVAIYNAFTSPLEAFNYAKQRSKDPKQYFDYWILGEKIVNEEKWEYYKTDMKHVTSKQKKLICQYAISGKTVKEISKLVNVGRSTIYKVLKQYNIPIPSKDKYGNGKKVVKYYKEGKGVNEIAKLLNISASGVRHWLKKYGLWEGRGRTKVEEVIELIKQGKKCSEILKMGYNNATYHEAKKRLRK